MDINQGTYQCEIVTFETEVFCKTHQETYVDVKMPQSKKMLMFFILFLRRIMDI